MAHMQNASILSSIIPLMDSQNLMDAETEKLINYPNF